MKLKDKRMKVKTETFNNIKVLKLCGKMNLKIKQI